MLAPNLAPDAALVAGGPTFSSAGFECNPLIAEGLR
jgi:hypothetical protein